MSEFDSPEYAIDRGSPEVLSDARKDRHSQWRRVPRILTSASAKYGFQAIDGEGNTDTGNGIILPPSQVVLKRLSWQYRKQYGLDIPAAAALLRREIMPRHRYTMLSLYDGDTHWTIEADNDGELTLEQCLDFIFDHSDPQKVLVGFAFAYDAYMMLSDYVLSDRQLTRLQRGKWIRYRGYEIRYVPRKFLVIRRRQGFGNKVVVQPDGRMTIKQIEQWQQRKVADTFGYSQKGFAPTLDQWDIGTESQRELIRRGKRARASGFADMTNEEVEEYNRLENELHVEWMIKLRNYMDQLEIHPREWYGPGPLAKAVLDKYKIKQHMPPRDQIAKESELDCDIRRGYFGGFIDLVKTGIFHNVYNYDINSAYPYAMTFLPCLCKTEYVWREEYDPAINALWHVRWLVPDDVANELLWMPFPFRSRTGQIYYAKGGEGFYWDTLVNAARKLIGQYVDVIGGYELVKNCDHSNPFAFVTDLYRHRQTTRDQGLKLTLKLILNSLYGKMAQKSTPQGRPPYLCYQWAGMITARTRAMIVDAIAQCPKAAIMASTDGLYSDAPLNLPGDSRKNLGEWEKKHIKELFVIQPGIYRAIDESDYDTVRTRGYGAKDIDWNTVYNDYHNNGQNSIVRSTRFVPLGTALKNRDYHRLYRHWINEPKIMSFKPSRRLPFWLQNEDWAEATDLHYNDELQQHGWYPFIPRDGISEPFPYKIAFDDDDDEELDDDYSSAIA